MLQSASYDINNHEYVISYARTYFRTLRPKSYYLLIFSILAPRLMCRAPGLADSPDSCAGKGITASSSCLSTSDECLNVVSMCRWVGSSGRSEELSWLMLHSVYLWFAQDPGLMSWPRYPGSSTPPWNGQCGPLHLQRNALRSVCRLSLTLCCVVVCPGQCRLLHRCEPRVLSSRRLIGGSASTAAKCKCFVALVSL